MWPLIKSNTVKQTPQIEKKKKLTKNLNKNIFGFFEQKIKVWFLGYYIFFWILYTVLKYNLDFFGQIIVSCELS